MTEKSQAFHNDPAIKEKYLARVRWNREQDHLMQGVDWETEGGTRGCAVGCTLENYDHSRYPIELGLPTWLAHLEDAIFEGLHSEDVQEWPEKFLEAIPVGADVEPVRHKLAIRRMSWLIGLMRSIDVNNKDVINVLSKISDLHQQALTNGAPSVEDWSAAESAAWSVAGSVTESAAWSAAESAAKSAKLGAKSAKWIAKSEASTELGARAAQVVAESAAWRAEADDLIELLQETGEWIIPAHKHAELMRQYAEDAAETDRPWERWLFSEGEAYQFKNCRRQPEWRPYYSYRRKPRTITINGIEVPEPVREPLKEGQRFYAVENTAPSGSIYCKWDNRQLYHDLLKRGFIHLTKEAAVLHAKALILASGGQHHD